MNNTVSLLTLSVIERLLVIRSKRDGKTKGVPGWINGSKNHPDLLTKYWLPAVWFLFNALLEKLSSNIKGKFVMVRKQSISKAFLFFITTLTTVALPGGATWAISFGAEYLTSWSGCECSGDSLSYTDNQINMFTNKMIALGHTKSFKFGNKNTWSADVTEDKDFNGIDWLYGDNVTMFAFSGHGGVGSDSSGNQTFTAPFCKAAGTASCNFSAERARLGERTGIYAEPHNGDLRYSMWLTCFSVHTDPIGQWAQTMRNGMDYVMGYRGTSADSLTTDEVPRDWAKKAMRSSDPWRFKKAWFWAIEDWWVNDTGAVLANGSTEEQAITRRNSYRRTWSGPHSDSYYWYAWSWHKG